MRVTLFKEQNNQQTFSPITDHKFRFAKLKISHILVQDYFGGPAQPTLAEYFAAKPEDFSQLRSHPAPEVEAELLPGAYDSEKWVGPVE